MDEYIPRKAVLDLQHKLYHSPLSNVIELSPTYIISPEAVQRIPAADVVPVSEIEKIIESLQEQADIYNTRAKELLVEEDGQVSQYTWAVSLRETYRRIIKTLDDLIS